MISQVVNVPNSSLILLDCNNSKVLFCTSSLALCKIPIKSMREALVYVIEEVLPIWPITQFKPEYPKNSKISLSINLSQECNLSCQYCYLYGIDTSWPSQVQQSNKILSKSIIQKKIYGIISSQHCGVDLNFFGGEPLIMSDTIITISEYALKIGRKFKVPVNIGITTNGVFLTTSFLKWAETNNVEILLSLDSPPSLHNKYRAKGMSYASFNEILKKIRGYEKNLTAVTTITSKTNSITNALKLLLKIGFKEVSFNIVHTRDPNLKINSKDAHRFLDDFMNNKSWFTKHHNKISNLKILHNLIKNRRIKLKPCSAGISSYAIGPDSNSYLCHSSVGNIKYQLTGEGQIQSQELELSFKKDVFSYPCHKCWAKHLCGGDCWIVQWEYSMSERVSRCDLIRGLAQLSLITYN